MESDLRNLQKDSVNDLPGIARNFEAGLQYETELGENKVALQEFDLMKEDALVYESVGPVLVKQDPEEPSALLLKTLGHLGAELERLNVFLRDLGKKKISIRKISLERRLRSLTLKETNASQFFVPKFVPFFSRK